MEVGGLVYDRIASCEVWDGYEYDLRTGKDVFYTEDDEGNILDEFEYEPRPCQETHFELLANYFAALDFWLSTQPFDEIRYHEAA